MTRIVITKAFFFGMLTSGVMFGLYHLATISSDKTLSRGADVHLCDDQGESTSERMRQGGQHMEGHDSDDPVAGEDKNLHSAGLDTSRSPAGTDKQAHDTEQGTPQDEKQAHKGQGTPQDEKQAHDTAQGIPLGEKQSHKGQGTPQDEKQAHDTAQMIPLGEKQTHKGQGTPQDQKQTHETAQGSPQGGKQTHDKAQETPQGGKQTHNTAQETPQGGTSRKWPVALPETISIDAIECPQDKLGDDIVPGLDCRKRLPQALGIGFAKCGTDAFSFFLSSHPAFLHSEEMEINFWDVYWTKGLAWYREQMPVSSQYQVTMEKTPSYVLGPEVPERIKTSMPDTKFILMVRDPVDRAVSEYVHMKIIAKPGYHWTEPRPLPPGQETIMYLNTTFEGSVIKPNGQVFSENAILAHSVYAHYFKKWLRVFPREQFLIIDTDEFTKNPMPMLYEAERFLGLPKNFTENSVYFNEKKGFYCRTRSNDNRKCLGGAKGRPHPTVDDAVTAKLRAYFRPFNKEFEKLVGRIFSWS